METTTKKVARILAHLLKSHGVRTVITSPGSRNAPLIVAINRQEGLETLSVVDERQAAFNALGIALETGAPVGIVCTSGTALLNYAPAVAEAYYRAIPLVVISADRPKEWIDQDDSQTLWQDNALSPYVKRTWTLESNAGEWEANRCINDALLQAVNGRKGPVHLNIRLDAPLGEMGQYQPEDQRIISTLPLRKKFSLPCVKPDYRFLVILGFMEPNAQLTHDITLLSREPNVVVLAEKNSNIHSREINTCIDTTLSSLQGDIVPEVVISAGGALVSRHIKEYIRTLPSSVEHWAVGESHTTVDCFKHLTLKIEVKPEAFFKEFLKLFPCQNKNAVTDFKTQWIKAREEGKKRITRFVETAPWSDFKAMYLLFKHLPKNVNLHLSNGTAIRYAQLFSYPPFNRVECNRGVSGIDGCLSTAIGASWASSEATVLISGDMSCQYDLSAMGSPLLSPKFKMIVLCNGGGGIFRFVESTRLLPEREKFMGKGVINLPLKELAQAWDWVYYEAGNEEELNDILPKWEAQKEKPAVLALNTPAEISAQMLREFFSCGK